MNPFQVGDKVRFLNAEGHGIVTKIINDNQVELENLAEVENLAARFPKNIIGVKDSSYNLMGNLKIKNFSILPGSELKLLSGLKKDCSGIITATCNVTAKLSRKVFDDFEQNKDQTVNDKLCEVRKAFDQFNLISGLHSFLSLTDKQFLNILPTCSLLSKQDEKTLIDKLKDLDFLGKDFKAA